VGSTVFRREGVVVMQPTQKRGQRTLKERGRVPSDDLLIVEGGHTLGPIRGNRQPSNGTSLSTGRRRVNSR